MASIRASSRLVACYYFPVRSILAATKKRRKIPPRPKRRLQDRSDRTRVAALASGPWPSMSFWKDECGSLYSMSWPDGDISLYFSLQVTIELTSRVKSRELLACRTAMGSVGPATAARRRRLGRRKFDRRVGIPSSLATGTTQSLAEACQTLDVQNADQ
jgi:hypothetical protein